MRPLASTLLSWRPLRYLVSGSFGASVHIGVVYLLAQVIGLWYVYATTIGFLVALAVSFTLQKFFTWRDSRTNVLFSQSSVFAVIATFNLILNNVLMFLFVEYILLVPVLAQFFASATVALWSYIAYSFIFTENIPVATQKDRTLKEDIEERVLTSNDKE